jgi:GT2 family glycosyltransferase/glycosyltransferase involved in cell wall biosynthesis
MIAIFLPSYPFRGLPAPYLWVFYRFLTQCDEPLHFITGEEYLDLSANANRWEHSESAIQRLGYTIPTTEMLERHTFHLLRQDAFKELLATHHDNPIQVFREFLTADIPPLGQELAQALNCETKPEAVITWCNCPTLENVAGQLGIPVLHIELGPLRSPHYLNTAYLDFRGVNGNTECQERFEALGEPLDIEATTSDLLQYFARSAGQHGEDTDLNPVRIGIALQVEDDSNLIAFSNGYDNSSLISHVKVAHPGELALVRAHPGSLFNLDTQKLIVDYSPDSACFLKRVQELITINSSVGLEALLREKNVRAMGDSSYGFITQLPVEQRVAALSFYLFGYLVPQELVFDLGYLRMRLGTRQEQEIIRSHIAYYVGNEGKHTDAPATLKQMIEFELHRDKLEKLTRTEAELKLKGEQLESEVRRLEGEMEKLAQIEMELSLRGEQLESEVQRLEGELEKSHHSQSSHLQSREATIRDLQAMLADSEMQQQQLSDQLGHAQGQVDEILSSNSWKFSAPVRLAGRTLIRVRRFTEAYRLARSRYASPKLLFNKTLAIYRSEGIPGVRLRLRQLLISHYQPVRPSSFPLGAKRLRSAEVQRLDIPVDIIVCVHNALDDVRHCLESVARYTLSPHNLILVDDGSAAETQAYLSAYAAEQGAILHRNDTAGGYTRAANCGLRLSTASYAVLLNSDTIASPYWLERLVRCAMHDSRTGIVGPLSNTASWQSVPRIFDDAGDWTDNPLPESLSIQDFANEVAREAHGIYPAVGFINGFCFLIKRELINEIGLFDEETFAKGYGEENDYCLRAAAAGWKLAVADDAYVFHAQSKSYSHDRRKELASAAGVKLAEKHGQAAINNQLSITAPHLALEYIRQRAALIEAKQTTRKRTEQFQGKRMLFVLPARTAGGGGNIILLEADRLRRLGVDAHIVNLSGNRDIFLASYPENTLPTHFVDSPEAIAELAMNFDAVVATLYLTVEWLAPLAARPNAPKIVYYIQDYEPDFFPASHPEHARALHSYSLIPTAKLITKTQWNLRTLEQKCGQTASVIGIDYDDEQYFPASTFQPANSVVRIAAMVRPNTPRRAPEMTVRVLKQLKQQFGARISLHVFGSAASDPDYQALNFDVEHENLGECSPESVAELLRRTDIFLDLSSFQAMGLTALEAMACGAAVVAPTNGGPGEFIQHGVNGLLVDTQDERACLKAAGDLVNDPELRSRLRSQAVGVSSHYPEAVLENLLTAVFAS